MPVSKILPAGISIIWALSAAAPGAAGEKTEPSPRRRFSLETRHPAMADMHNEIRNPVMPFLHFEGPDPPRNHNGDDYPNQYPGEGEGEVRIDFTDGIQGNCLDLELYTGYFYPQFNPYYPDGTRGFAREHVVSPEDWRFNTYNRLSFWIKAPRSAMPVLDTGQENVHFGTYVKNVINPDPYSDESGNNHWYHHLNIPNSNTWTRVIINMHPDHLRDADGGYEHGNQPHTMGESEYNYFDSLTRFYISQQREAPVWYPAVFKLDEFVFYEESRPENDEQVYSIAATYVRAENRIVLTWGRHKDENDVLHEVRYAFRDIHEIGWGEAIPAPEGWVTPLGWQGYNGMVYESTEIPLARCLGVYLGIRPENSDLFSQVFLPLRFSRGK